MKTIPGLIVTSTPVRMQPPPPLPEGRKVTPDGRRFKIVPEGYVLQAGEFWLEHEDLP